MAAPKNSRVKQPLKLPNMLALRYSFKTNRGPSAFYLPTASNPQSNGHFLECHMKKYVPPTSRRLTSDLSGEHHESRFASCHNQTLGGAGRAIAPQLRAVLALLVVYTSQHIQFLGLLCFCRKMPDIQTRFGIPHQGALEEVAICHWPILKGTHNRKSVPGHLAIQSMHGYMAAVMSCHVMVAL